MKQNVGRILDNLFETSIKQALYNKGLEEKEKQVSLKPAGKGEPPPQEKQKQSSGDDEDRDFDAMKNDGEQSSDDEKMKGNVELDDIVEKLNTIRSGKSFSDSLVQQRFEQYFGGLKDAEKTAMFVFLKGIAGVCTGEVEPQQIVEPDTADVTIHKGPDQDKKHVKPNVIKTPSDSTIKPKKSGGEDTSAPISVKKR